MVLSLSGCEVHSFSPTKHVGFLTIVNSKTSLSSHNIIDPATAAAGHFSVHTGVSAVTCVPVQKYTRPCKGRCLQ